MNLVLIDAGGANLGSVRHAIDRLDAKVRIARDADGLRDAQAVILPGVGAAGRAMQQLRERGFVNALRTIDVPLFGICLGMQLLFDASEEQGAACLGVLPGIVRALPASPGIRVPHMGWNQVRARRADALLSDLPKDAQAYFVHSYAAPVTPDCVATATHGIAFAAIVRRGTIMGAQFHPERSGAMGQRVLRNFLALARSARRRELA